MLWIPVNNPDPGNVRVDWIHKPENRTFQRYGR
jgi:hypothetical protein